MKGILTIIVVLVCVFSLSYFYVNGKPEFMRQKTSFATEEIQAEDTNSGENNNYQGDEPSQNTSPTETNICQKCGNRFTGRGYTEIAHGVWRETKEPYQTFICSESCGSAHTRKWESVLGNKSDGKVYDNEQCGMCEGTGIERNHSSMSNEYGRTCPMCNGKGYQSY